MTPTPNQPTTLQRVAGVLLVTGLMAGPVGTHVYWMLGGDWGLGGESTVGIQVVGAVVALGLVTAVLIVLARVGFWQQTLVSDRKIRILTWALAVFFVGHGLMSFAEGWAGVLEEWWLYGPSGLVIGLLALVVARSGTEQKQMIRRPPPRAVSSH
jgi:hypothetical protein